MPALPIPVRAAQVTQVPPDALYHFIANVVSTCGAFAAECNLGGSDFIEISSAYAVDATTRHINISVPVSVPVVQSLDTLRSDIFYGLSILLSRYSSASRTVEVTAHWLDHSVHRKLLRIVIRSEVMGELTSAFSQLLEQTTSTRGYKNNAVRPLLDSNSYSYPHRGLIAALNMAIHMQSNGLVSIRDVQHKYKDVFEVLLYHGRSEYHGHSMSNFLSYETEGWARRGVEIANSVNSSADIRLNFSASAPDRFLYEVKPRTSEPTTTQQMTSKIQPSLADTLVDLLTDNEHGFLVTVMLREAEQLSIDYKSSDYETHCRAVEETMTLLELFPKIFPGGDSVLAEKLNPGLAVDAMGLLVRQDMNKNKVRRDLWTDLR